MSLEIMKEIVVAEEKGCKRKSVAEAEAREIVAAAERDGLALLQKVREEAIREKKRLFEEAELRASDTSKKMASATEQVIAELRDIGTARLDAAAMWIIERVVGD